MKMLIPKITLDAFEIFGDEKLEQELDQQEKFQNDAWNNVYNAIASGKSKIAYWDIKSAALACYNIFVRYALHQSPKKDGFLQLSVMHIQNDEIIPVADSQYNSVDDFLQRIWSFGVDFVTIM